MYKILIKTCSASNNIWNFYQEDGVDYIAASLEDMKPTALTLLKKYGKKNIKIIDQMSGQDMDNADVYIYDSTDNYEELSNRPYINGTEIVGQLTLEDLGIQPAGDYLNQNDLEEIENKINNMDLSAYATNTRVDEVEAQIENIDLTPYATKEFVSEEISNIDIPETDLSGYATEEYVDDAIAGIDIPETDLTDYATIQYVDDAVANIDVPDVDLSDYYNKTEIDDKLLTVDVNVEGLDIYSDEERVIGRWVDGRPLYQKYIYIGELTNGITDTHLDDYGIKAHEVRFHQVYKMGPDGILCLISPQFMSMAGKVIVRVLLYQEESGFNVLRVATGEDMDVEGHTAYAIVTYTKPDDEILLPTSDYYPATQKYVNDAVAGAAQVNHYICTASTKNPGILNFAVTHVRPTSTRLLEIIEEGFTNIANGVNEGFVLDYSPNNNSVANWNNVTIHTNYIKPSDFTQTTSYELLAYTQRKAVVYLGVLKVNGTWSDNKFTCSSVEQPGVGAWTQFNFDLLLTKANTTEYTPTNDYNPATKKYVDDAVAGVSGGSGGGADLTNYYTKAEVDALLQELRNEFVSANNNINDKLETIIYGGE